MNTDGLHWCFCGIYNEPAYPNTDCDCGASKCARNPLRWVYRWLELRIALVKVLLR